MTEAEAFGTFIRISELLSASIKLAPHKVLIGPVMIYACPAWELATETYLLKLQRLQKVFLTIGNLPRRTPNRDLDTAFNLTYVYDYKTKLCRQQVEVIQNHENEHVLSIAQGEARQRKYCI
jgi:hypothetical protein